MPIPNASTHVAPIKLTKQPGETLNYACDFGIRMAPTETVKTITGVTQSLKSGSGTVTIGTPVRDASKKLVEFTIAAGVDQSVYRIQAEITTEFEDVTVAGQTVIGDVDLYVFD